jgi:inhibitor of cysteine peptidase
MLPIDKTSNGHEVEVGRGESFEVTLDENPTTGYRWRLVPPSASSLEIQEDSFVPSGGAHGAGGYRKWRFRAIGAGSSELKLERKRGWEDSVAETFQIAVRVKPH